MQKQLSLQLIHVPKVLQFINGKRSNGGSKALNLNRNNMWAGDGRNKTIDHTAQWLSVGRNCQGDQWGQQGAQLDPEHHWDFDAGYRVSDKNFGRPFKVGGE
ncbi:hypothetical protein B0H17DRAFT_1127101 [Mycena rosella]|uniref:Uncharacterized protein n=1 Tax=Mycena rosella TaxID=1033263 RepID=A0AAD7GS81_MYCRO|nr:hypothetical protein B0H17DRAFT_1127101 [Mycena rosella]